jgi:hypothetical protein
LTQRGMYRVSCTEGLPRAERKLKKALRLTIPASFKQGEHDRKCCLLGDYRCDFYSTCWKGEALLCMEACHASTATNPMDEAALEEISELQ